jgi:dihydrofolate reductase
MSSSAAGRPPGTRAGRIWLLANGLLDELRLLVHPIVVEHGQRLFEDTPTHPLRLVREQAFSTGVLNLTYAPASAD